MTNILVAYDQERAIGKNNDLPWGRGLPGDLVNFKALTLGASVVMGRKTFESLPPSFRPLPGRENIVLSRDPILVLNGALCVTSLAEAMRRASHEVFVIGGGQIYEEALTLADKLYATEVHHTFPDTDTFFPEISTAEWLEATRTPRLKSGTNKGDQYDYDFVIYERNI